MRLALLVLLDQVRDEQRSELAQYRSGALGPRGELGQGQGPAGSFQKAGVSGEQDLDSLRPAGLVQDCGEQALARGSGDPPQCLLVAAPGCLVQRTGDPLLVAEMGLLLRLCHDELLHIPGDAVPPQQPQGSVRGVKAHRYDQSRSHPSGSSIHPRPEGARPRRAPAKCARTTIQGDNCVSANGV
ncbi:hypothetical protein [Streptomyces sp. NPDC051636]|uniref:hypothetical protein n=1 Tax=Streptomyces sp. NPDC051636 TaxID=3365663 RepID=UPI0037ADCBB4